MGFGALPSAAAVPLCLLLGVVMPNNHSRTKNLHIHCDTSELDLAVRPSENTVQPQPFLETVNKSQFGAVK